MSGKIPYTQKENARYVGKTWNKPSENLGKTKIGENYKIVNELGRILVGTEGKNLG